MGLTTWKNSPDGRILKSDVITAKNYLDEKQIRQLERAVSGYFDYIEDLIEREIPFNMQQFASSVNEFLNFRKYDILERNGKISHKTAEKKEVLEYEIFNKTQKINSDFDKMIKELEDIMLGKIHNVKFCGKIFLSEPLISAIFRDNERKLKNIRCSEINDFVENGVYKIDDFVENFLNTI